MLHQEICDYIMAEFHLLLSYSKIFDIFHPNQVNVVVLGPLTVMQKSQLSWKELILKVKCIKHVNL